MKHLSTLFLAIIIVVTLTTSIIITRNANALGGQLFGSTEELTFDGSNKLVSLVVRVPDGWLNSDVFSLYVTNTGNNSGGTDAVQQK